VLKFDGQPFSRHAWSRKRKIGLAKQLPELLSPAGLNKAWIIDEIVRTWDMCTRKGIMVSILENFPGIHLEYTGQEIRDAAEASPHISVVSVEDYLRRGGLHHLSRRR